MTPDPLDTLAKFEVNGKKEEFVGVITTYILWEIQFHTSIIVCPLQVLKNLKSSFDKVDKSQVMQIDKELISMDPHCFERIEDYLTCIKELQLKLTEFGKGFPKKDG